VQLLTHAHIDLIQQAIRIAQQANDLPTFEMPEIPITASKKAGQGDYNTPIALSLAKIAGMKPRDIAEKIVQHMPTNDFISKIEIAGAGFINFTLSDDYLKQQVESIITEGDNLFQLEIGKGKRAQVEFVSANPTGPLTIGRSRGAIVGDTMARLIQAAGYELQREYYFNNAGNQMVNLGNSLRYRYMEILGKPLPVINEDNFYKGDYLVDYAKDLVAEVGETWLNADWQPFKEYAEAKMFEWIKKTLQSVGIHHNHFFNEDSLFQTGVVWQTLETLRQNGYIYTAKEWAGATAEEKAKAENNEPAQWFKSTAFGDEKDRVLVKSDGVPTYSLPDIAYHKNKIERGFDVMINVLGADHGQQYKVVAWGIKAMGLDPQNIHVIIIQMVRFMKDGAIRKGSTRKGVFDTLDDLVEEVGADAIRYHLLARSPSAQLVFDVNEVVKQSNDNPVYYIQNAHVRCVGIAREAKERGLKDDGANMALLGEDELIFIRKALELGDVIANAVNTYEPHGIAFFAQELAGTFHPIYDRVRALHSDVPTDVAQARLRFYRAAQVVFKRVLDLMGMTAPERM
jgi:arginyl-tRNA synthetase